MTLRPAAFPDFSAGPHFTEFREAFPSFRMFTPRGNARITVFIQCVHAGPERAVLHKGGSMKHKSILSLGVFLFATLVLVDESGLLAGEGPELSRDDKKVDHHEQATIDLGRQIFRFDTFGDEAWWGDTLKLHQAIAGARNGGVGPGVSPATTLALLKLNAVVGVTGIFDGAGNIKSMGVQCALCHSTVDDSFAPGIGERLDGRANRDLNVGLIVSLAPNLTPIAELLQVDVATVKAVLNSWGPGRFDAELDKDGKAFRPDGGQAGTLIPPAFALAGVNLHTW